MAFTSLIPMGCKYRKKHRPTFESLESRALLTAFHGIPNDPDFGRQWSLHNVGQSNGIIDADIDSIEAWEVTTGSMETVVAVLDDGVDYTHPDLYLNIWLNEGEIPDEFAERLRDVDDDGIITFRDLNASVNNSRYVTDFNGNGYIDGGDLLSDPRWENGLDDDANGFLDDLIGWDAYDNDNDPSAVSNNRHGTGTSKIIGGVGNNSIDGAGLNWQIRMVPVRVREGGVDRVVSHVTAGLDYAIVSGASIADAGWRGSPNKPDDPMETASVFSQEALDALERTREAGLLIVAAAGNGARDTDLHPWYPQSYGTDNMITVAALSGMNSQLELSDITNWGANSVDVAVPTTNGATSHALAVSVGVAALIKSQHPDWTYAQIKDRMMNSIDVLPSLVGKTVTGGKLNAAKAVGAIEQDETIVFSESFEGSRWSDAWSEATRQNWKRVGTRYDDGISAAEINGVASKAPLTLANPVDLSGAPNAELSFSWQLDFGFDNGEYLALDLFDGAEWSEVAIIRGDIDPEFEWHQEKIQLDNRYLVEDFNFRFRARANRSNEYAYVDRLELVVKPCGSGRVIGDSNLDGVFDSRDFVLVFQTGEYEDGVSNNSDWTDGDWNCDGEFDSSDFVAAFQAGTYEQPRAAINSAVARSDAAAAIEILFVEFQDTFLIERNEVIQRTNC